MRKSKAWNCGVFEFAAGGDRPFKIYPEDFIPTSKPPIFPASVV
jgi:hypothetical protein